MLNEHLPLSTYSTMNFYALVLVPLALACGPGTGPITATPTMQFTFSHPLSWTYFVATPGPGQSLSQTEAQNRINQDIEFAVLKAVESYGYSTSGVSVKNAVAPEDIEMIPEPVTACVLNQGIREDTVVGRKCTEGTQTPTNATVLSTTSTITVTSPIALAQSNWENIATKVWASLVSNAGVKFYGMIEIV